MKDLFILSPEIFLGLSSCFLLMLGAFGCLKNFNINNCLVALIIAITIYIVSTIVPVSVDYTAAKLFDNNQLTRTLHILLLLASFCFVILYSGQKFAENSPLNSYEFQVIFLISIAAMMLLISSHHLLSLYVSIELQSLCLYSMAAFEREDSKSSEAGLKYFVLGSFASGLLLFGISLIYGFAGNLELDSLEKLMSNNHSNQVAIGIIVGVVMILMGLFFKVSAAPFHMWAPDVYQGSPTIVTSFFATVTKIAAIGILLKLTVFVFSGWIIELRPIYIIVAAFSMLIGAIGALKQNNIKRLLAYSSIGHVGYILMAIAAGNQKFTIFSVLAYLLIYVSMTMGAFAFVLNLKNNANEIVNIQDLSGLSKARPVSALFLAIFMFSLAGIPPMAGFFAKFYVFQAAIDSGLYLIVAIAVISSIISAYYYLKIIKIMYLDELNAEFTMQINSLLKLLIILLVLFNLLYIIW